MRPEDLLVKNKGVSFNTTFTDAGAGIRVPANTIAWILEIIIGPATGAGAKTVSIYQYTSSTNPPAETTDRVLVDTLDATYADNLKIMAYINRTTSGLYPRVGNTQILTLFGYIYDPIVSEWSLISPPTAYTAGTDVLATNPPASTDNGEWFWMEEKVPILAGTRLALNFWCDANIDAGDISIPCLVALEGKFEA